MFGMKDDGMRAMRMKAKSKYLDDLLADNEGKMALEIKKVYVPGEGLKTKEVEFEGEENGEMENEYGAGDMLSKLTEGAGDVAQMAADKMKGMKSMAPEGDLSEEEIIRLIKQGDLAKLLK